jgi:hypothetical protein
VNIAALLERDFSTVPRIRDLAHAPILSIAQHFQETDFDDESGLSRGSELTNVHSQPVSCVILLTTDLVPSS